MNETSYNFYNSNFVLNGITIYNFQLDLPVIGNVTIGYDSFFNASSVELESTYYELS